jgi:hypothetical protein
MSKPTKEDNDASLLAMENHLFYRLFDDMTYKSQSMYAFIDHIFPHSNKPTIQETPVGDEISSTPPHLNRPTVQESHHLSNSCDNTQPLHNSFAYTNITPPHLNNQLYKRLQMVTKSAVPLLIRMNQLSKSLQTATKSALPLLIRTNYLSKRLQMAMK